TASWRSGARRCWPAMVTKSNSLHRIYMSEAVHEPGTEPVSSPAYDALRQELRDTEIFASVAALLSWDQETMLPPAGTPLRAEQAAVLGQVIHERRTSERFGDLLAQCEADENLLADPAIAANLREVRRIYDQAVRIPTSLVRQLAET